MPYYATGENRDSYITGIRPGSRYGAAHDVEKRRDNLPDNVFHYIKEGVQRELRQQRIEEYTRARTRLDMFARPPKTRTANNANSDSGAAAEAAPQVSQLEQESDNRERHAALRELYARERQEWEEQLGARGLATQRN